MRNPGAAGGVGFSCSLIFVNLSTLVCVYLYTEYDEGGGEDAGTKITSELLWGVTIAISATWWLCLAGMLWLMDPDYYKTFYSTENGLEYVQRIFRDSTTDEAKVDVFKRHPVYYAPIKGEVKAFAHENWAKWKAEKPAWFTARFISTVDDEYIPVAVLTELDKAAGARGGKRWRSTIIGEFAGVGGFSEGSGSSVEYRISFYNRKTLKVTPDEEVAEEGEGEAEVE